MFRSLLLCLISVGLFCACDSDPVPLDVIQTDAGKISGSRSEDGQILSLKGIPFAEPPIGDLRWHPPKPTIPWTGVMACTTYSASPFQPEPQPFLMYTEEYLIPKEPISEDCLYLNVWTGAASAEEDLPVLVWIYGGGFATGGSACPIYDGEELARKGIVVVTINYRVGPFGFFAHPELTANSTVNASGNYGLLDQIAALKWVRNNISRFGGDPDQVTIAGQSAGAASVHSLMVSPLAKGLFHRAIGQSGSALMAPATSLKDAEQWGQEKAAAMGIGTIDSLRDLSADSLLSGLGTQFRPILDGYVLAKNPREMMSESDYNDVPLLVGWNLEEGFPGPAGNADEFSERLLAEYGPESASQLAVHYPSGSNEEAMASQRRLNTHQLFSQPVFDWASLHSRNGESSTFLYVFDHTPPGPDEFRQFTSHHTAEVPYALHTLHTLGRPWEPVDEKLEKLLSDYWVQFVKEGNPNLDNLPVWVEFEAGDPSLMKFSTTRQDVMTGMGPIPDLQAMEALQVARNR